MLAACAALLMPACAHAQLQLHPMLGENAVLQRERPITIAGTAAPDTRVTVQLADETTSATAGPDGRWRVSLAPRPATDDLVLRIEARNEEIVRRHIAVGDVILCSGQSNMQFTMARTALGGWEGSLPIDDSLRLFQVPRAGYPLPRKTFSQEAQWFPAKGNSDGFSAVCLLAGRQLARSRKITVGLIDASLGGTPIEAWLARDDLAKLKGMEQEVAILDDYAADEASARILHDKRLAELWTDVADGPGTPGRSKIGYANLYNAMLAPIGELPLAGAIWYQGEANARNGDARAVYMAKLTSLIGGWRERYGTQLPVAVVQIAPFGQLARDPGESRSAEIREAQRLVAADEPLTELVVTMDVGERLDIHPPLKQPVAERAAAALDRLAGIAGAPTGSPQAVSATRTGDIVHITVIDGSGSLFAADGGPPSPLAVCRKDGAMKCTAAEATLTEAGLAVTIPAGTEPGIVRYCWAAAPICNIFDDAQLPLGPFELAID